MDQLPDPLKSLPPDVLERLTASPRPVYRALLRIANAYAQTGGMALNRVKESKDGDYAAPSIVCTAFAIELLLKFFVAVERPTATGPELGRSGDLHGHPYSKLWARISHEHKMSILEEYRQRTGKALNDGQFMRLLKDLGDDPFVRWRYMYERSGPAIMDMKALGDVANALGFAAQEAARRLEDGRAGQ